MRKYQQLALLLLSFFSVLILILYKNENNRLKDVLHVVNFFGRSDVQVIERSGSLKDWSSQYFELLYPLPVFQTINTDFHVYAAYYWDKNELKKNAGEACAQVVGKKESIVNFRCTLVYNERDGPRKVTGKFHFQRVNDGDEKTSNSEYILYYFYCQTTRDFGLPASVVFTEGTGSTAKNNAKRQIRLRHKKPSKKAVNDVTKKQQQLTVCLNLIDFNENSAFAKNETNLLQFFVHHHNLGVDDFFVYASENLPPYVFSHLRRFNARLFLIPFNFPFSRGNDSLALKKLIETDCLIRNTNYAKFTTLLEINEFLYLNKKAYSLDPSSALQRLNFDNREKFYFDLNTISVCMSTARNRQSLLLDNTLYDPSIVESPSNGGKLHIYRAHIPVSADVNTEKSSTSLSQSMAFTHRYIECVHVGKDGLSEWQSSVREDFMTTIVEIRKELNILLFNQTIEK